MRARCIMMSDAHQVFEKMPQRVMQKFCFDQSLLSSTNSIMPQDCISLGLLIRVRASSLGFMQARPRLYFNRLGSLLVVSTNDNCVRILGSVEGFDLLHETDIQLSRNLDKFEMQWLF
ncbi:Topless-related protein 1 [Platanthera zijinensis]|uniref:Topless-related protein 1 n=1 Tax=Platanthera zijinensis TaxID=2320716 RepID=A0AAP0B6L3_9ASPA